MKRKANPVSNYQNIALTIYISVIKVILVEVILILVKNDLFQAVSKLFQVVYI
ncbi:MAG: hypothetical protein P1P82_08610 [Bacteroidales bacterium]|nr:hypothetical protein [Bacteroidales bacterium]